MKHVHSICYTYVTKECSESGHKEVNLPFFQTEECVKETFEGNYNENKDDNKVLRELSSQWKQFGTGYWPSVVINKRTFRGDLTPDNVFSAICAGFHTPPKECGQEGENAAIVVSEREGITGTGLIVVVVLLVFINLLLIIMYRRCSNKEMKDDMQL